MFWIAVGLVVVLGWFFTWVLCAMSGICDDEEHNAR